MLLRMIVSGVIACGLVAADTAAMAEGAGARMFKGRTAQGHRIKVLGKQGMFRIHAFDIELRCRDGSTLVLEEGGFLWTKVKRDGSFRDSQFGDTDSIYFRGSASERRIRGRIRVTDREKREPFCASRWIAFSATPG